MRGGEALIPIADGVAAFQLSLLAVPAILAPARAMLFRSRAMSAITCDLGDS